MLPLGKVVGGGLSAQVDPLRVCEGVSWFAGPRWQSLIGLGLVGAGASRHAAVGCAGPRRQSWILAIFDWRWAGGRSCV